MTTPKKSNTTKPPAPPKDKKIVKTLPNGTKITRIDN